MNKTKNLIEKLQNLKGTRKLGPRNIILMNSDDSFRLEFPCLSVGAVGTKIKHEIESLKIIASHYGCSSLSANQIGSDSRFFIITKRLKPNLWLNNPSLKPIDYITYINPEITKVSTV